MLTTNSTISNFCEETIKYKTKQYMIPFVENLRMNWNISLGVIQTKYYRFCKIETSTVQIGNRFSLAILNVMGYENCKI